MSRKIKCKKCGHWIELSSGAPSNCSHCGTAVQDEIVQRTELLQKNHQKQLDQWMFKVDPSDGMILRMLKNIGNVAYWILMAIAGFIAWLVAAMPG